MNTRMLVAACAAAVLPLAAQARRGEAEGGLVPARALDRRQAVRALRRGDQPAVRRQGQHQRRRPGSRAVAGAVERAEERRHRHALRAAQLLPRRGAGGRRDQRGAKRIGRAARERRLGDDQRAVQRQAQCVVPDAPVQRRALPLVHHQARQGRQVRRHAAALGTDLRRVLPSLGRPAAAHGAARGVHRARARHGRGLRLAAVGHPGLRLGQVHEVPLRARASSAPPSPSSSTWTSGRGWTRHSATA